VLQETNGRLRDGGRSRVLGGGRYSISSSDSPDSRRLSLCPSLLPIRLCERRELSLERLRVPDRERSLDCADERDDCRLLLVRLLPPDDEFLARGPPVDE